MDSACIPYTKVPKSSSLFLEYLYHFDHVARFYNGSPFEIESFRRVARDIKTVTYARRDLADILLRQNRALGCGEATLLNILRLAEPETLAVVTGQQVGLFSGPAFTLYKALTAVKLAQHLTEQGISCVPVFWLATEDHDLEEVARTGSLDDHYNWVELKDTGLRPAPQSSVGYVKLSDETATALDRLESTLPAGESRDRLLGDLRDAYRPGATWGEAFGRFLARLLGRWGVIFLDPLQEEVHRLCAPIYRQAIEQAADLRARLVERSHQLVRDGYHAQVHVGDDSTLLFMSQAGSRVALHQRPSKGGGFSVGGTRDVSAGELTAAVANHSLDFTPNALFRPVVQDKLLPTVAYVAGPAELAYHAQTAALYPAFGRPQPVIFPRAGFTLIDARAGRVMQKYGVRLEDAWQGEEHLNRRIVAAGFAEGRAKGWAERLDQSEQDLGTLLERLRHDIEVIDPTLVDLLRHTDEKVRYQMERLRGKVTHAALQRSDVLRRHAEALSNFLTPRKDLQERQVSGVYFLGRAGYTLLERLLAEIQIGCSDQRVLSY
ncbi:MAG TPA: bacillithiol biosynthesis cysteine-adding enzyme BshC [Terriglobia bacterium]|nr:bacillithiol biosynthesis cysteine-adding enzyme BshC [Terriglobia bacterium]